MRETNLVQFGYREFYPGVKLTIVSMLIPYTPTQTPEED